MKCSEFNLSRASSVESDLLAASTTLSTIAFFFSSSVVLFTDLEDILGLVVARASIWLISLESAYTVWVILVLTDCILAFSPVLMVLISLEGVLSSGIISFFTAVLTGLSSSSDLLFLIRFIDLLSL